MEQLRSTDWIRHIPKIFRVGAVLSIIGIFLPANHNFQSSGGINLTEFVWYFGLYFWSIFGSGYSEADTDFIDNSVYLTVGIIAAVLLFFAFIFMVIAANKARNETDHKISAATGLLGGILAFISIGEYYFGLKREFPTYWNIADPSFGFYLPLIGGILGTIGAVAVGYAYSLEIKGEPIIKAQYTPIPDKVPMEEQVEAPGEKEKPNFCKNCGAKLLGPYCQSCGAKAEF
ncbi:MAG: hypothetical protein ACFFBE_13840 [Promethearchaeota archaeon]